MSEQKAARVPVAERDCAPCRGTGRAPNGAACKVSGSVLLIQVSLRNTAPSELGHVIATVKYATATKPPQFKVTSLREISSPVVAVSA